MAALPQPPPEAELIARKRKAMSPELSMRQAAKRAGFSAALWAKIEHGYDQVARGIALPYSGTADKVAKMARITGVTEDELADAGRKDAAAVLAAMPPPPAPQGDQQSSPDLEQRLAVLEREFRELQQRDRRRAAGGDQDDEQEEPPDVVTG